MTKNPAGSPTRVLTLSHRCRIMKEPKHLRSAAGADRDRDHLPNATLPGTDRTRPESRWRRWGPGPRSGARGRGFRVLAGGVQGRIGADQGVRRRRVRVCAVLMFSETTGVRGGTDSGCLGRFVGGCSALPPMLIGFPSGAALVRAVFRRRAQDPASCSPGRRPDGCLRRDTSGSLSAHVLKITEMTKKSRQIPHKGIDCVAPIRDNEEAASTSGPQVPQTGTGSSSERDPPGY